MRLIIYFVKLMMSRVDVRYLHMFTSDDKS